MKKVSYIDKNLFAPKDAWDALSLAEKSEMMKVAVRNGITDLKTIRQKYNEFADGGTISDEDYYDTMEKVADENYQKWGFSNPNEALVHALNDNTYDYRGYYGKYPQSKANADTHWTDEFKTVWHPTFSDQSIYSGQKSQFNPNGLPGGFWVDDTFFPKAWQVAESNKFADGGIHIKPENRGKFTRLKERTGHSATWFKEHGTPAQKKMATFALNARHWKHREGGNLFDGITNNTGQMQIGLNVTNGWKPSTLDQILANADKIQQQRQTIEDAFRESQIESNDNTWVDYSFTIPQRRKNPHLERKTVEGAKAHAAWEQEHPTLTAWGNMLGTAPFAVAAAPAITALGDAAAGTAIGQGITSGLSWLGNAAKSTPYVSTLWPWADAAMTSAFGAHGIQDAVNGKFTPMTALEIAPLARLGRPMVNEGSAIAKDIYDNGTLWDAYTTFGGRLGNYGDNVFSKIYGTAARRFGLPDKARIPADAMRKLSEEVNVRDGLIDFTGEKGFNGNYHINTSLDRPVVSHSGGNWDRNDLYIFPTRNFLEQTQGALKSIEPSDMFANGAAYRELPKNVTVVSGDTELLTKARGIGMQTLSSPRLRRLYEKIPADYQTELEALNNTPLSQRFLVKTRRNAKYNKAYQEYADEVQRLQSQRGTPTLADFRLLEEQTGLNAGVAPISEYDNAVSGLQNMENTIFSPGAISKIQNNEVAPYIFPNGREVEWSIKGVLGDLESVQRAKYNKVFYDPTSHVEANWRFPEK